MEGEALGSDHRLLAFCCRRSRARNLFDRRRIGSWLLRLTILLIAMRLVIMHFKTRVLKGILGRSHFGTNKKDNKYRSLAEEQKAYAGLGA